MRARLDPHQGDRAEPVADRADARRACRTATSGSRSSRAVRREGMALAEASAAMCWSGCASTRRAASTAAICATRRGFSGRCWKRRSRATSSPTSRSATSRSTAPTRGTTCDSMSLPRCDSRVLQLRNADGPRSAPGSAFRPRHRDGATPTIRNSPHLPPSSTARRSAGSAAACPSARSMPARATAANWKSTRSTTRSTTWSASACASSPRRAMPMC